MRTKPDLRMGEMKFSHESGNVGTSPEEESVIIVTEE